MYTRTQQAGITLLLLLTNVLHLSAQNIGLAIKGGLMTANPRFTWTERIVDKSKGDIRPAYALYGEGRLSPRFSLGAEIGFSSFKGLVDLEYMDLGRGIVGKPTYNARVQYYGWYQSEQFYFAINPQFTFKRPNSLSLGVGMGVTNNFINRFHSGQRSFALPGNTVVTNLEGVDLYLPSVGFSGYLNAVFRPKINDQVSWLFELRYVFHESDGGQLISAVPFFGYHSLALLTGLSLHW